MYPLMVIKRDNTMVKFDRFKICSAIFRASKEVNRIKETQRVIGRIADMVKEVVETADKHLSVDDIQNLVEDYLIELAHPDVAKAYIKYRYLHDCARGNTDSAFDKIIEEKINAKAVVNQNANVDEASFGGRMGETADGILKKYALDHLITHKIAKNHIENRVYIHDLGHYVVGDHNCLTIPFDKLLEKGFNTRQVDIRPAHSLNTAFQLVAVVFQLQSLCQFGGVSASHLDYTLVPYFRLSFVKHFRDILGFVTEKDLDINENDTMTINAIKNTPVSEYNKDGITEIWEFALKLTLKELHKGVQGMFHNLNSLQSRSGNQLPFTSINFGTNITEEGRYIIKAILEGSIEGVGKFHRTSVFPCMIFQVGNGINKYPGDPNYDMFRLALECTAKRLYPNYVNMDWSNWAGYDKNKPEEFPSTMGACTGDSRVSIKIGVKEYDLPIANAYQLILGYIRGQNDNKRGNLADKYKNVTAVYKITHNPTGKYYIGSTKRLYGRVLEHRYSMRHKGTLGDNYFIGDYDINNYSFTILYENCNPDILIDLEDSLIDLEDENCVNHKSPKNNGNCLQEGDFEKALKGVSYSHYENRFRTVVHKIDYGKDVYVLSNNRWVPVRAIMYNDDRCPLPMYQVTLENGTFLNITVDHPLHTSRGRVMCGDLKVGDVVYNSVNRDEIVITDITKLNGRYESYDFEVDNDCFDLNGIISHNCRTATAYDVNGLGHLKDGRGNIAPSTVILPTIAMESYLENKEDVVATFFLRLEKAIDDCIEGLYERYLHITQQSPKSATFMYENGTFEGFDGKSVESALKHGSLAVGQLGLAECLQILIGKNHTTTEGMKLAKQIEEFFSAKCKQAKEKYHLNYGVYYTPAENLSHTALEKFRKKYGIIPKVSDREYFTNSMHVPVWEKLNPFEKIDIESQLTGYSTAGCITYVEMESSAINNIEALETLVVYAMDKNIPYFAINLPNDCCNNCGFQGELPDVCPECGSKNIQRLRRVTGYLTNDYKTAFNKGKVAEVEDRLKHSGVKL